MKKIILFLLIYFSCSSVFALTYGGCNYSDVSRMKNIVSNINISYDYKIINNEAYFSITLNNLTGEIYFYDTTTKINYYYNNTNNGEITISGYKLYPGNYRFYSNKKECYGTYLGSKYYDFPSYNIYYKDPLCSDIPNYSLCQKWVYVKYSRDEFEEKVYEYKESKNISGEEEINIEYKKTFFDTIVEIYIKYYYYFLGSLILLCSVIIVINNRKNRFRL